MGSPTVKDVIKSSAQQLLINLNDDEVEEIQQELIDSGTLEFFIQEMENLILEKANEGN